MVTIMVANSTQDAEAAEAVIAHHLELSGAMAVHVEKVINAASQSDQMCTEAAARELVQWCTDELIPHALAEEAGMYQGARKDPSAILLIDSMITEHRAIIALVDSLKLNLEPVRAAATAQGLRTLFESHLHKENDQILPLLAASKDVSLAEILGDMHELLGKKSEGGCGGDCTCND